MDWRLSVALLAVVLAGCSIPGAGGPGTERPSAESATTTTGSQTATAAPSDATRANTVVYDELSEAERRAVDAAIRNEARFYDATDAPEGAFTDTDLFHSLRDYEYVRQNGTYYRLSTGTKMCCPSYHLYATPTEPAHNVPTLDFQNLSENGRRIVHRAIENESSATEIEERDSLPDDMPFGEYVRHGNQTYRLQFVVGDGAVHVLEADKVEYQSAPTVGVEDIEVYR